MCKNTDTPCPGCKRPKTADDAWVFFTDAERQALERPDKTGRTPVLADAHP